MNQKEVFKDIPNYEGKYQISNLGIVKSIRYKKERILKQSPNSGGYNHVSLGLDGIKKTKTIHQLVAVAFLGHTPNGYKLVIDHIDGDVSNNKLNNLQLITQRENIAKSKQISNSSSKYVGVQYRDDRNKFIASIRIGGKPIHLGYYKNEKVASAVYQLALDEYSKK